MNTPEPKTNKFDAVVILATMRTGSNLLERILIQHPQLIAAGELFNPHFIGSLSYMETRKNPYFSDWNVHKRDQNLASFLKELRVSFLPKIPVFRFFPEHDARALNIIIDDPRIAKVVLKRNSLDSFVSSEISYATDQWLLNRRTKMDPNPKFKFDMSRYENWVTSSENFYQKITDQLENDHQSAFELRYETIKDLDTLNAFCEFIGLETDFSYFFEPLDRQNKKPIKEYLSNPEILKNISSPQLHTPKLRLHDPVIRKANFARNLNLVYVPIAGNAEEEEQAILREANNSDLEEIPTENLPAVLKGTPEITAYSRVLDPRWRTYSLFLDHVMGKINGFDKSFADMWEVEWGLNRFIMPTDLTPEAFEQAGLKPNKLRRALRAFIIGIRKELWSGHRNHLLSDQFWPQSLIIENLNQRFPVALVIGNKNGQGQQFEALKPLMPVRSKYLNSPYNAQALIQHRLDQQLHDLYREDYEMFGFELDQSKLKP